MTQNINGNYAYAGYGRIASWEASSDNPPSGKSSYARGDGYAYSQEEVRRSAISNAMYFEPRPSDTLTLNGERIELFEPAIVSISTPELMVEPILSVVSASPDELPSSEIPGQLAKVGISILLIPIVIIVIIYLILVRR